MRVVFACGGTAGHITPALAIAEELKKQRSDAEFLFVGVGKDIEARLIEGTGYTLESIPFVPILGKGIGGLLKGLIKLPGALSKARALLRTFRADVVIGFGGYPAFAPVLGAATLRIPRILHEQNVQVGLANKALSLFVNKIYAPPGADSFWGGAEVTELSNPVREAFTKCRPWTKANTWRVLISGGSQGAVSLNTAVLELADLFGEDQFEVVHQCGERDLERVREHYKISNVRVEAFIENMLEELERAHLIICRAGAMTVAEVSAAGRPAIYVPLPIAGGHQARNAEFLVARGAALLFKHSDSLAVELRAALEQLFAEPKRLQRMAERARSSSGQGQHSSAELIVSQVLELGEAIHSN